MYIKMNLELPCRLIMNWLWACCWIEFVWSPETPKGGWLLPAILAIPAWPRCCIWMPPKSDWGLVWGQFPPTKLFIPTIENKNPFLCWYSLVSYKNEKLISCLMYIFYLPITPLRGGCICCWPGFKPDDMSPPPICWKWQKWLISIAYIVYEIT